MTDILATAALMFGFALVCVLGVVYLLSKRQITVNQTNSPHINVDRSDSGPVTGGGSVERFVIKWAFILLVAGIVIATLLNAVNDISQRVTNAIQTAPSVSAPAPVSQPVYTAPAPAPRESDGRESPSLNPWHIVLPLLAVAVVYIWFRIISLSIRRRKTTRAVSTPAQREQHLNDILPDVINQL